MISKHADFLQSLPKTSGVYFFKNNQGIIIYIGKAKSIQHRIKSYFAQESRDWKVKALLQEHATIEWIETASEEEALLLEAQLIGDHKPKYNVLLKSGHPFLYILFTKDPIPKIALVRNTKQKGTYFGPFLHKSSARSAFNYVLKTFRLEWCKSTIAQGCLKYHLGLCAGNCIEEFDVNEYIFRIRLAQELLKGNYAQSQKEIATKIQEYTNTHAFEKAKTLYEYAQDLNTIFTTLKTKFSIDKYVDETTLVTAPLTPVHIPDKTLAIHVQKFLNTELPIHIIDCFDISHFQSKYMVGAVIRFIDGMPDKNSFRRFSIRSLNIQNDCAALQEIAMRRYHDVAISPPDLIIVDGGIGQRNAVKKVIPDHMVIGLAKKEERIYIDTFSKTIPLDIHHPVGKLFIAIRDYTHHFAITYHRVKRKNNLMN